MSEQGFYATIGEGTYFDQLDKAAAALGMTPDEYVTRPLECTHSHLDEAQTQQGDCACGCRNYRWCPDCDESVEII